MGDIQPQTPQPMALQPQYCSYCGSSLDSRYYFCTRCAMPYESPYAVVPAPAPMPLFEGELIRRKAPHVWPMFWTYFGLILALAVVNSVGGNRHRPDLMLLIGSVALAFTTFVFASIHWRSLAPQLRCFGFLAPAAWVAIAALVPLLLLNWGYHNLILYLANKDHMELAENALRARFATGTLVLLYCIFPAVTEELAFRGLLQHWLSAAIRPHRALIVASALFAAMHLSILSAPYLFLVGLLLGWTKWKTGSLYPSMLLHFLHNLAVVVYLG